MSKCYNGYMVNNNNSISILRKETKEQDSTECFIFYRKSVLHLLMHMFHVHLSRYSTDLRKYTVHPVYLCAYPVCLWVGGAGRIICISDDSPAI